MTTEEIYNLELNIINEEIELLNKTIDSIKDDLLNIINILDVVLNKISLHKKCCFLSH